MTTEIENQQSLHETLYKKVNEYLSSIDTKNISNFREMYLEQVEPPLLESVMAKTKYNQVRAAKILGMSRGTLRKKLKHYFDDKYCGTREE
jgi:Fis family transcriptional regulator, factor for inversion stimulation protein